jgi:hypothetical protein
MRHPTMDAVLAALRDRLLEAPWVMYRLRNL